MLWLSKHIALLGLTLIIFGCGFQPLHGDVSDRDIEASTYLASIDVLPISGTLGSQLHIVLEDKLNPSSAPSLYGKAFTLGVQVKSKRDPVIVDLDGSISRYNINLTSTFKLTDSESGELLHKGMVRRVASFNVADEKFAAYVAEKDAVQRALVEMAEDYKLRLAAYFAQHYKLTAGN